MRVHIISYKCSLVEWLVVSPEKGRRTLRKFHANGGFSLIEVMVALLVFLLGMLGVALFTAGGLKTSAVNQVRANVIHATSQAAEPVLYHSRSDCLATVLGTFPRTITSDNGKDSYTIRLVKATDGAGTSIATIGAAPGYAVTTTASTGWISPVTIVLGIPVTGTTATAYPSYTIVLQNYTVSCDV